MSSNVAIFLLEDGLARPLMGCSAGHARIKVWKHKTWSVTDMLVLNMLAPLPHGFKTGDIYFHHAYIESKQAARWLPCGKWPGPCVYVCIQ